MQTLKPQRIANIKFETRSKTSEEFWRGSECCFVALVGVGERERWGRGGGRGGLNGDDAEMARRESGPRGRK